MRTAAVELGDLFWREGEFSPGVVMLHDVWGLTDHTRDLAGRLASEGFTVLALSLYRREPEVKIEDPGRWMRSLSDPRALADVEAAARWLGAHEACAGRRVGVTGFCMGGMYALLAACGVPGIDAAAAFYGLLSHEHGILHDPAGLDPERKPRQPLDAVADLACPLLCLFGDADEFVPGADIEALRERLATASAANEVVVYPGCGHAFMNDTRPDAFRPDSAKQAWSKTVAFLHRHLD